LIGVLQGLRRVGYGAGKVLREYGERLNRNTEKSNRNAEESNRNAEKRSEKPSEKPTEKPPAKCADVESSTTASSASEVESSGGELQVNTVSVLSGFLVDYDLCLKH
jgi:hypothetical protein